MLNFARRLGTTHRSFSSKFKKLQINNLKAEKLGASSSIYDLENGARVMLVEGE